MYYIYGRQNCSYCEAAKALLNRKGLAFKYFDIEQVPEYLEAFKAMFPNAKTVPQIHEDGNYIGGYKELEHHATLKDKSIHVHVGGGGLG